MQRSALGAKWFMKLTPDGGEGWEILVVVVVGGGGGGDGHFMKFCS